MGNYKQFFVEATFNGQIQSYVWRDIFRSENVTWNHTDEPGGIILAAMAYSTGLPQALIDFLRQEAIEATVIMRDVEQDVCESVQVWRWEAGRLYKRDMESPPMQEVA